eukprot:2851998-Alexandrium_andersonii.AAC.1
MLADVQAGVAASKHQLCFRGPTHAGCVQESSATEHLIPQWGTIFSPTPIWGGGWGRQGPP